MPAVLPSISTSRLRSLWCWMRYSISAENWFESRNYRIRHPQLADLPALLELEVLCWAEPLRASGEFPEEAVEIIAVAEEANNLEKVLVDIAESMERRTYRYLELFVRLLEPAMLLVMALLVLLDGVTSSRWMRRTLGSVRCAV